MQADLGINSQEFHSSCGHGESSPVPRLVEEDNRPWVSRAINVGRHDDRDAASGHRQRSALHTASESNEAVCGAVSGALVPQRPISVGRSGNVSRMFLLGSATDPSIGESNDLERREKALGPHSGQAGVAPCPQETHPKSIGGTIAEWTMIVCIIAASAFIFSVKAKAQNLSPYPVFCQGAQKHIKNVLSKTGMFKDAFALSGEGARQVSQNIFNHVPAADHVIIIRQINGGSIMVPCVWGKNGPQWAGEQSNRVTVDFVFKRELENPKTEIPVQETRKGKP